MSRSVTWLVLLICGLALYSGCSERFESSYADKAAAVEDGAVRRGWIPPWVPESATAIREVHDLDTNEGGCPTTC
jgi:hypothetical protein